MSKTYRRVKNRRKNLKATYRDISWLDRSDWLTEQEKEKFKALWNTDAGSHDFKEPGPTWFRNLYERAQRREDKRELQKFLYNENYEPQVYEKKPLPYWT